MVNVIVDQLSMRYVTAERTVEALTEVSFTATSGQLTALVGPSGSGKTTLLRILACQLSYDSGKAEVNATPIPPVQSRAGSEFRNKQVGYVFQEFGLIEQESARFNVALPMRYAGVSKRRANARADSLLCNVDIPELATAQVRDLSAGQRQRVAFARAQANDPGVILADEPTSNLDAGNRSKVMGLLKQLRTEGKCVIVATHDEYVWQRADVVVRLDQGRVVTG